MRLKLILPRVEPDEIETPTECPYEDCDGRHFRFHQAVNKPLRDTKHTEVTAQRHECLKCGRTFRVYPPGVTRAQTSLRVKGLAVMLYLLGLSYGAVALATEALGVYVCKSRVYDAVQEAAKRVPGLKRETVFADVQKTPALGGDITSVKCNGKWLPLGLTVDDTTGLVLTVDELSAEDAETLKEWIEPIAEAVGAEILISDDADAFKTVADELGLEHQVCKGHVKRNTEALIESLREAITQDDGSLAAIGVTCEQALADLERLEVLIKRRQPEDEAELATLTRRYQAAPPPGKGERASVAYRLRMLFLDRWNLWGRLTRYRTWQGPAGESIDGTNNGSERAIGWWVKERYRTMRGYKRPKSAVRISRLLAWCGSHLESGGVDLTPLVA